MKDVPVDGFWSISVYNKEGYFEKNEHDAYTLNNLTAKKNDDGSISIQFGGWDGKGAELSADHAGLELHRAALSSAGRNPRRRVEVPGGATCTLSLRPNLGRSVRLSRFSPVNSLMCETNQKQTVVTHVF